MSLKLWSPSHWLHPEKRSDEQRGGDVHPMSQLHQEIDRLFEDAFKGFSSSNWPELRSEWLRLSPSLDIVEGKEDYSVTVELPGVEKDDVNIQLDGRRLTISGEKKQESKDDKDDYHRVERSYGRFQRVLMLPDNALQDQIDADFKNGVLTLKIPKSAESISQTREVPIK